MFKNLSMACGTFGLMLILVFGRDVASYITTSADQARDSVREHIPVEFELGRARAMIDGILPQIRQNMYSIAREEVELEQLIAQIERLKEQQKTDKTALKTLQRELNSGGEFKIGPTVYTSTKAASVADAKFDRYRTHDATLRSLMRTHDIRRKGLDAARRELDTLVQAKQQLTAEVASLRARQKMTEVARSATGLKCHDSQLARTRELLADIETRIKVEERLANTDSRLAEEKLVPLAETSDSRHVADRIAEYFQTSSFDADLEMTTY